jgi:hypothetical protein
MSRSKMKGDRPIGTLRWVSVCLTLLGVTPAAITPAAGAADTLYPPEEYLRGVGEGDLAKGRVACQRVSELAARTDLAKQIRVRVTEHAVDRLRERMGRAVEQDIEVVREEMVNELLRDVRIVDRRVDETSGTCTSVAVMPRSRVAPDPGPDKQDQPTPLPGP